MSCGLAPLVRGRHISPKLCNFNDLYIDNSVADRMRQFLLENGANL